MNVEAALKLTSAKDLKRAAIDAETHNVEFLIVRELYRRYFAAAEKESLSA
jgi:hypothetical protein